MPPPSDLNEVEKIIGQLADLGVSDDALAPARDWLRDRRSGKPQTVVYFGCWSDVGHFLWLPGKRRPDLSSRGYNEAGPFKAIDGRLTPRDTVQQSAAKIHHLNGWTAVGMNDYTVDKRGGSNAVFIMDSDLSFERAMEYAAAAFPKVVERINAAVPIALAETCSRCPADGKHDDRRR